MKIEITQPADIIADFDERMRRQRQALADILEALRQERDRRIDVACEFGGLIQTRTALAEFLEVSPGRVSQLLTDGRIRQSAYGFSAADAENHKRRRKSDRPRWCDRVDRPAKRKP